MSPARPFGWRITTSSSWDYETHTWERNTAPDLYSDLYSELLCCRKGNIGPIKWIIFSSNNFGPCARLNFLADSFQTWRDEFSCESLYAPRWWNIEYIVSKKSLLNTDQNVIWLPCVWRPTEVQLLGFRTVSLLTSCDFGQVLNLHVPLCPYLLSRDNI